MSADHEPVAAQCPRCDRTFPHYHTVIDIPAGGTKECIVSTPDVHPRAEVRDSETGEVIFPAVKGPLTLIAGGLNDR